MAASTADRSLSTLVYSTIPYGVADNVIIYLYCSVCTDSNGWLNLAAPTASFVYAGIAMQHVDNTVVGHSAGGLTCDVRPPGLSPEDRFVVQDASSPAQTWVGAFLFFTDDHTVNTSGGNSIKAGLGVQILVTGTSGKMVVDTARLAA